MLRLLWFFCVDIQSAKSFQSQNNTKIKMAPTCGELLGHLIQQNNALMSSASWNFGFQIVSCGFGAVLAAATFYRWYNDKRRKLKRIVNTK